MTLPSFPGGRTLGLAMAPDGRRFACTDSDWGPLDPDHALAILLWYLAEVEGRRGLVVRTAATTHLLDRIAQRWGCGLLEVPVGDGYMARALARPGVLMGAHGEGELWLPASAAAPSAAAACQLLAQAWAAAGPLGQVLVGLFDRYGPAVTRRRQVPLAAAAWRTLVQDVAAGRFPERLAGRWIVSVDRLDGCKFRLEDGAWAHLRHDGATAHLTAEAESPEQADAVLAAALALVASP